jgi:hypothetical protein
MLRRVHATASPNEVVLTRPTKWASSSATSTRMPRVQRQARRPITTFRSSPRPCRLTMRLSDAGLRRWPTKLIYPNHRLPPWLTEDATPRSLEPIVRGGAARPGQLRVAENRALHRAGSRLKLSSHPAGASMSKCRCRRILSICSSLSQLGRACTTFN